MIKRVLKYIAQKIFFKIDRYINRQWYDFPFGRKPKADKNRYHEIAIKSAKAEYPEIDNFESETGFSIDQKWLHELALHTQVTIKKSEICYQHGRLLYSILSKYLKNNNSTYINIIETGTARGFSTLCMAKALFDSNREAKIITFDVIPHNIKMYWNCIDDLEGIKTREELLANYSYLLERYIIFHQGDTRIEMQKVYMSRIHFAFLDGEHTYSDVLNEFNNIKDKQIVGDIIFFDDYTESSFPGVVKAIDEICTNYNYSKRVINANTSRSYVLAVKQ